MKTRINLLILSIFCSLIVNGQDLINSKPRTQKTSASINTPLSPLGGDVWIKLDTNLTYMYNSLTQNWDIIGIRDIVENIKLDTFTFFITQQSDGSKVKVQKEGIISYDNDAKTLQFSDASPVALTFINSANNYLDGSQAGQNLSGNNYALIIGDRAFDDIVNSISPISIGRNNLRDVSSSLTVNYPSLFGQNLFRDATGGGSYWDATGEGSGEFFGGGSYVGLFSRRAGKGSRGSNIFFRGDEAGMLYYSLNGTEYGNFGGIGSRAGYGFISTASAVSETSGLAIGYNCLSNMTGKGIYGIGNNITSRDTIAQGVNFTSSDINISLERITVSAHGFGSNGSRVNAFYSTTGTEPTGIQPNRVYQFEIIDENTLAFPAESVNLTSQGTGNHRLTLVETFENVAVIGDGILIKESNSLYLGNDKIENIFIGGQRFDGSGKFDLVSPGHTLIMNQDSILPCRIDTAGNVVLASTSNANELAQFLVTAIDADTLTAVQAGFIKLSNDKKPGYYYFLQDDSSVDTLVDAGFTQVLYSIVDSTHLLVNIGQGYANTENELEGSATSITTDSNGKFSFTHNAAFTPDLITSLDLANSTDYVIAGFDLQGANIVGFIRSSTDYSNPGIVSNLEFKWKVEN